jgi:N-acetylmuramoyl-L-alanine amidase
VTTVGFTVGVYDAATTEAVARFQLDRGLRTTGECDEQTWLALVEAGWHLGDRVLVLAAPQVRGDDVVELQQALNRLGFDCGRPDGILGPATVRALVDFQRNSGLVADGMCGHKTVTALELLRRQSGSGPGVASIREEMSAGAPLAALRVVLGQFGGLSSITRALARQLRVSGAAVMCTDEYEATAHAAAANRFGASVYLGFEAMPDERSVMSYFAVPQFESVGGRALAEQIAGRLVDVFDHAVITEGMRLPVLRETRMPAVLCTMGPVRYVVDSTDVISTSVISALGAWSAQFRDGSGGDGIST